MPEIRTPVEPTNNPNKYPLWIFGRQTVSFISKFLPTYILLRLGRFLLSGLASLVPVFIRQAVVGVGVYASSVLPALVVSGLNFVANLLPVLLVFGLLRKFWFTSSSSEIDDFAGATATTAVASAINPAPGPFGFAVAAALGASIVETVTNYFNGNFNRSRQIMAQRLDAFVEKYPDDKPLIKAAITVELNRTAQSMNNLDMAYLLLSQDQTSGAYKATLVLANDENKKIYSIREREKSQERMNLKDPGTNNPVIAWDAGPLMGFRVNWGDLNPNVQVFAPVVGEMHMHNNGNRATNMPAQGMHHQWGPRRTGTSVTIAQLADEEPDVVPEGTNLVGEQRRGPTLPPPGQG